MAEKTRERAWDVADRNIAKYRRAIERAKLGGKPNIAVCQAQLDRWLEYRSSHGPDDLSAEL